MKLARIVMLLIGLALLSGCACRAASRLPLTAKITVEAPYSANLIADDGFDHPVWKIARAYSLVGMPDVSRKHAGMREPAVVQFAWDQQYFYMRAEMKDSDVVTESSTDGLHQYLLGDVCELFLKPAGATHYWEFHATPNDRQSTFYFLSPGRRLPSALQNTNQLTIKTCVAGSLNGPTDRDNSWIAIIAVPISLLTSKGDAFDAGASWQLLAGRYNYSAFLDEMELSSMPGISEVNFHRTGEYATLKLTR